MGLQSQLTYPQLLVAIREIILDVNPVQAFSFKATAGQGFVFKVTSTEVTIGSEVYNIANDMPKVYNVLRQLQLNGKCETITYPASYAATEVTTALTPCDYDATNTEAGVIIKRDYYFSDEAIHEYVTRFVEYFYDIATIPPPVAFTYQSIPYFNPRQVAYWVAYYLIDKMRMNFAAVDNINGLNSAGLINTSEETITSVGDVFKTIEKNTDGTDGKGMLGFTSFWGDKYSYYTKLQLWIREQYERMFKDFSLRDDAMICQTFSIEKTWEPFAYIDSMRKSPYAKDIFTP